MMNPKSNNIIPWILWSLYLSSVCICVYLIVNHEPSSWVSLTLVILVGAKSYREKGVGLVICEDVSADLAFFTETIGPLSL